MGRAGRASGPCRRPRRLLRALGACKHYNLHVHRFERTSMSLGSSGESRAARLAGPPRLWRCLAMTAAFQRLAVTAKALWDSNGASRASMGPLERPMQAAAECSRRPASTAGTFVRLPICRWTAARLPQPTPAATSPHVPTVCSRALSALPSDRRQPSAALLRRLKARRAPSPLSA